MCSFTLNYTRKINKSLCSRELYNYHKIQIISSCGQSFSTIMAGKFNIAFNSTLRILAQQIETQALFSKGKLYR
jgi:hypothetical protein